MTTKTCSGCGGAINGTVITAQGEDYCAQCFVCSSCKKPIAGSFQTKADGSRLCEDCVPVVVCAGCEERLTGTVLNVDGKDYHPDCHKCADCSKVLAGKFFRAPGRDFVHLCQECAEKSCASASAPAATAGASATSTGSSSCARCMGPVKGSAVKANDQVYCKDCFTCAKCSVSLATGFFTVPGGDGSLLCRGCAEEAAKSAGASVTTTSKNRTCVRCKKPIEGEVVVAQKGDEFHPECFTCESCGKALKEFIVDESAQYKFQTRRYICPACPTGKPAEAPAANRPCVICEKPCEPGPDVLELLDGSILHWACFTCCECGKAESPSGDKITKTLLRTRVQAAKAGRFVCDACSAKKEVAGPSESKAPPAAARKKILPLGTYLGKGVGADNDAITYAVALLSGRQFRLDFTSAKGSNWQVTGSYDDDFDAKTLVLTVESYVKGTGPPGGNSFTLAIEKLDSETNDGLNMQGVHLGFLIGVPDFEVQQMLKSNGPSTAPAGGGYQAQEASAAAKVIEGTYSLTELQDKEGCQAKGLDMARRECYLPDDVFNTTFKMSKDDFEKLPKWKRDNAKKQHNLF
eukprot:TRINITY_DN33557_c0_g1_i1.p1 TRINITY_DN33557_c0_g1~~TRINITY_DN33557_c0_g1_i1.p1  ORF type:complete len:577 (+),score=118.65 TRINITY_DN33557_c0_g1_i1:91-1821(+)